MVDMLTQFFKGVNYTSPTWDFGLGFDCVPGGYATAPAQDNTAARMTGGAENYPTTNNFSDAGARLPLDYSAGAIIVGVTAVKFTPPVLNFTDLVVAPGTDMAYIIDNGSTVLLTQFVMVAPLETLPAPGDFFEITIQTVITPQ